MLQELPKGVVLHAECVVQDWGDIILSGWRRTCTKIQGSEQEKLAGFANRDHSQYPDEALVQLGVRRLQVVELNWFAEQLLVERQGEAAVDVVAVENRQSHHTAHEVEVRQVVLGDTGKDGETGD